ncbi:MAG: BREX system P-loop protein BrxC [Gammaproteobacteria bacterium]|nr:BREX system P-loop protein BrxC [Gammaproteobacteria bacterium]
MQIKNLFAKDLFRPINGVVKADQQDEAVVWQELDEYVVTRELDKHLRRFFDAYLAGVDNPKDSTISSRMGVWVSGFFGSGKSHFIKILSYLLRNRVALEPDSKDTRRAVDFFDSKIDDALLLGDIKRAVGTATDVILFNIDSKADSQAGRDAVTGVFLRVFNEMQGFSGDAPHIAEMERHLTEKGVLDKFHAAFRAAAGEEWLASRDAYSLMGDELVSALSSALDMSTEAATKWYDKGEKNFTLTIEGLANRVSAYLDSKGPDHRIVFLVDEVGQFIGNDTSLMLSLQTITEDLGRICKGRAWVIVTSQEDIDAVVGEFRGQRGQDFSKIQGRFYTRLSLSSTNTDEVIQARLLEKTGDARRALEDLYQQKGDILKNQLSFSSKSPAMKGYRDKEDFVLNYPFAPFHFQLVQKIFESIRKAGATGLHLSRGERSMLDAFQSAAKSNAKRSIGALIPLSDFYASIESFLDTAIKRTIEQAEDNPNLDKPFDTQLLRTLFLIRYVDIVKADIDNLVTLCIDQVDADRLALKRKIEDSLLRLEKETLIGSSGDVFFFLTNEEREVGREIKNVDISGSEEIRKLSEVLFEDVLRGVNKHRFKPNRRDYAFNRVCDGQPLGTPSHELTLEILLAAVRRLRAVRPTQMHRQERGRQRTGTDQAARRERAGPGDPHLAADQEIHRSEKRCRGRPTLKRILADRAEENRERLTRLVELASKLLVEADYFALGQSLDPKAAAPSTAIDGAIAYLVENIYPKLGFIKVVQDEPLKEIKAVLWANDIGQQSIKLDGEEGNPQAVKELRDYLDLMASKGKLILAELVDRFTSRPYGWPEWEIVLLVSRLMMAGEIRLMLDGAGLEPKPALEPLSKSARWKQVALLKRQVSGAEELKSARQLGQNVFGKIGPDDEDGLVAFLRDHLAAWEKRLAGYKALADTGKYPGKAEAAEGVQAIQKLLFVKDAFEFVKAFLAQKAALPELAEDVHNLSDFYDNQRRTWDRLRDALEVTFKPNQQLLAKESDAATALQRMTEILAAPHPYGLLHEVEGLIGRQSMSVC